MKITLKEIRNIDKTKIYSIKTKLGLLATLTEMKYYVSDFSGELIYHVVTRAGILEYFGNAQKAVIYGTKNKHYKNFKTEKGIFNYINKPK